MIFPNKFWTGISGRRTKICKEGRGMVYVGDSHESWVSNLGGLRRVVLVVPAGLAHRSGKWLALGWSNQDDLT